MQAAMSAMQASSRARMGLPAPTVASCDDFLVRSLKPGSYTFLLSTRLGWAATPVEIVKKNLSVSLTLSPPAEVNGRFVVAREDGTLPPLEKVRITLLESGGLLGSRAPSPDDKGAFVLKDVRGPNHQLRIEGLGNKHYIQEIRVDGKAIRASADTPYPITFYQGSQLEVVIDDLPATITGAVTEGAKPFSQPLIFVAESSTLEVVASKISGDNDVKFLVTGLPPGEYRVVAVQSTALPDGMQISDGMLGRLWSSAAKVTLERGGSQDVAVKLSDPLR